MRTRSRSTGCPQVGVKDSKRLTEKSLLEKEKMVREICPAFEVVVISPRIQRIAPKMRNLNRLAWAHPRALESLLEEAECRECHLAVADQFGDEGYLKRALIVRGARWNWCRWSARKLTRPWRPRPCFARATFLRTMEGLSKRVGVTLPAARRTSFRRERGSRTGRTRTAGAGGEAAFQDDGADYGVAVCVYAAPSPGRQTWHQVVDVGPLFEPVLVRVRILLAECPSFLGSVAHTLECGDAHNA